jgi:cytoskeletal protein CcmA (bactofilin family)
MFGSKKQDMKKDSSSSPSTSGGSNSIVFGTKIEGNLTADSDIRIDGEIIGNLDCKGKVILGPDGKFQGEIKCINAVLEGIFTGNLFVKELLNVRETAKVSGDIVTDKLIVQSGAIYNVTCRMGGQTLQKSKSEDKQPVIALKN